MENAYENFRRKCYEGGAQFVPVCEKCGRFVKADKTIRVNEITGLHPGPNADCSKCGRTRMLFEGFL
jgi:ribosomal protein S26